MSDFLNLNLEPVQIHGREVAPGPARWAAATLAALLLISIAGNIWQFLDARTMRSAVQNGLTTLQNSAKVDFDTAKWLQVTCPIMSSSQQPAIRGLVLINCKGFGDVLIFSGGGLNHLRKSLEASLSGFSIVDTVSEDDYGEFAIQDGKWVVRPTAQK
ncbi:MAG: hypothetical protein JWO19_1931 [Bryobacterales bacterium]|nr:hypothetical protein [Bryobacterales bacterium]